MTTNPLTTADIEAGLRTNNQEREKAQLAHDAAALAYARDRNDPEAQTAIHETRRKLEVLDAEASALNAARSEAKRIDAREAANRGRQGIDHWLDDTLQAVDAMEPALAKVNKTIGAFAEALAELRAVESEANAAMRSACQDIKQQVAAGQAFNTKIAVECLLWFHTKEEFQRWLCDSESAPLGELSRACSRERERAKEAARFRREKLRAA